MSTTSSAKRMCLETLTTSAAALFSSSVDEEDQSAPMMSTPMEIPPSGRAQFSPGLDTSASSLEVVTRQTVFPFNLVTHDVIFSKLDRNWETRDGERHGLGTPEDQTDSCSLTSGPTKAREQKNRMWIEKDSVAFQDLSSLVLDKRVLKDLEKTALFKHTGEPRFKQVYCKKSKQWILKTLFTPHTTQFIRHLINRVMDRRHDPNSMFKVPTSSLTLAQPALPANIAPVPKPPKEAATTLFKSRF
ncbi:unnamed protein product [Gadus morhua 'NCC']